MAKAIKAPRFRFNRYCEVLVKVRGSFIPPDDFLRDSASL